MLFEDQPKVNAIATTKKIQSKSQIIIIIIIIIIMSPRAQMMMMSLKCEEHANHTFSKKSFNFPLV